MTTYPVQCRKWLRTRCVRCYCQNTTWTECNRPLSGLKHQKMHSSWWPIVCKKYCSVYRLYMIYTRYATTRQSVFAAFLGSVVYFWDNQLVTTVGKGMSQRVACLICITKLTYQEKLRICRYHLHITAFPTAFVTRSIHIFPRFKCEFPVYQGIMFYIRCTHMRISYPQWTSARPGPQLQV